MIIIPFLNGYFIGNIPYFQTNPYGKSCSFDKPIAVWQFHWHSMGWLTLNWQGPESAKGIAVETTCLRFQWFPGKFSAKNQLAVGQEGQWIQKIGHFRYLRWSGCLLVLRLSIFRWLYFAADISHSQYRWLYYVIFMFATVFIASTSSIESSISMNRILYFDEPPNWLNCTSS